MVELQWEERWAMWRNNAEEVKYNEYYLWTKEQEKLKLKLFIMFSWVVFKEWTKKPDLTGDRKYKSTKNLRYRPNVQQNPLVTKADWALRQTDVVQ